MKLLWIAEGELIQTNQDKPDDEQMLRIYNDDLFCVKWDEHQKCFMQAIADEVEADDKGEDSKLELDWQRI